MAAARRTGQGSSHRAGTTGQPRQLPGAACEQCRKRKLRCDRQRPQCGTCADVGIICEVNNNRLARGPKKGDLKALRSRIAVALERRLSIDHAEEGLTMLTGDPVTTTATDGLTTTPGCETGSPILALPCQHQPLWQDGIHVQVSPLTPTPACSSFAPFKFPPTPPLPPKKTFIDDLMRADLDQLYFDRVHPNIPILNHWQYFSKTQRTTCTDGPDYALCLQYAMWTLAMALSSQFENLREIFYTETRKILDAIDMADCDAHLVRIEQVQAWLLVAFYEFARSSYCRASISAGRAFRLVQLAGLHQLDQPGNTIEGEEPVVTEEKRRTFWVAYCLDRLISLRSRCPLTLTEEVVCTRLPSPELAFQGGHPIPGCFLSDAIASGNHDFLSPLAEVAIVATISGRALSHCQSSSVERASGTSSLDFWLRHELLDGVLRGALDSLSMNSPLVPATDDPMLLFALMMAHATTIFLCQIAEALGVDSHCTAAVMEYQHRGTHAAREIAGFARAHEHIGYFKAHIFLPLAIFLGASQLTADRKRRVGGHDTYPNLGSDAENELSVDGELEFCIDALRKIQSFNNLARDHLAVLESQDVGLCGL
ncbi:fungal-specific transcription factor domain-containing protein [Achaetomium macrosporum]|uniref:Fungal-specific transcription factor domain-containing protein n=1 Tax=Achaetomium macrosporum TaxID=79813 RepID=A0AAN7C3M4_9PEZI|nr:fungal-specific transcription factor domain-containing protein [Achaetomium macrosporum]